ncbi:hypothetical protein, partial [Vibrio hepatarius]|uniref:hypothetical protein n=1 Tax=Vibrio hepatarius TaxID=171383 RepID=UPI001C09649D
SASCEIGVINDDGSDNLSNTIILPSLTSSDAEAANVNVVGEVVNFSIGPVDPAACASAASTFDMVATGDQVTTDVLRNTYGSGPANMGVQLKLASGASILDNPLLAQSITDADSTIVDFTSQLFHVDDQAVEAGLIGSVTTITTAYY